jgi:hypothetical protein
MDTRVRIKLKPITETRAPQCDITVGYITKMIRLDQEQWIEILIHPDRGSEIDIVVKHHGKTDEEFKTRKELAISVEEIEINGITDPKFVWSGQFHPEYPRWEEDRGPIDTNYLGFNGEWKLTITIPAYTWIHKILSLGWIYD